MSTELVPFQEQKETAQILAAGTFLHPAYQKNYANVFMVACMGEALGLNPVVAINSINIIKGKPAPSAELMAALVLRAGHRLDIKATKNPPSATVTLTRKDNPDAPYTTTWDKDVAARARLWMCNDAWQKYPDQMLRARAISEACRAMAPDVLAGCVYTPDELGYDAAPGAELIVEPAAVGDDGQSDPEPAEVIEAVEEPAPKPEPKPKRKPGRPRKAKQETPAQEATTAPSSDETPQGVDMVTGEIIAPETGKQPPEPGSPEDSDYHLALVREYQNILGISEERMQSSAVWAMQGDAPAGEWDTWPARTLEAVWRNLRKEAVNRGLIKDGE